MSHLPRLALSVTAAADLLPMGAADARRWLRDRGLVRVILGREMVLISDVEAQVRIDSPRPIDATMGLLPAPVAKPRPAKRATPFIDPREE